MRKKRIEYLLVTWSLFIVCFVLYGAITLMMPNRGVLYFFGVGLLAGYGFSGLLGGCIMFARFISKKSLAFKIVCSCLFLIPFAAIAYVGLFGHLPYSIYNLVKIIRNKEDITPLMEPVQPYEFKESL